jgi:hypothetical protein
MAVCKNPAIKACMKLKLIIKNLPSSIWFKLEPHAW